MICIWTLGIDLNLRKEIMNTMAFWHVGLGKEKNPCEGYKKYILIRLGRLIRKGKLQ